MKRVAKNNGQLVLARKHLVLVRAVLRADAPRHRAYVFGSRVVLSAVDRARLKPHSDLDLVLEGPPLKPHQAFALKEAFSEGHLPKVSGMMRGDLPNLSERKLMDCLTRLGYDIEISVRPAKAALGI